ncbi:hypothetical protein ACPCTO_00195 [Streptomyces olivoreticuli]
MKPSFDREAVRSALEARGHPLQRFDLILEVFWAAGCERSVYRTVYDLPETHVVLAQLIDRMRKDGTLVLLSAAAWEQILGSAFQPRRSANGYRGNHWYATAEQHAHWQRAAEERRARIAAIAARLGAAGPLLLRPRITARSAERIRLDSVEDPRAVYADVEIGTPDGCLVAGAELLANAPADLAFLLSLVQDASLIHQAARSRAPAHRTTPQQRRRRTVDVSALLGLAMPDRPGPVPASRVPPARE